jgi:hypothetical protein
MLSRTNLEGVAQHAVHFTAAEAAAALRFHVPYAGDV